jgi:hypothetical protein
MRCTLPSYRRAQGTDKKETGNKKGQHCGSTGNQEFFWREGKVSAISVPTPLSCFNCRVHAAVYRYCQRRDVSLIDATDRILVVRTKKPTLRITRWLRRVQAAGPRIPLEAECTACSDAQFTIKHDKRSEYSGFHQPNYDSYGRTLQREFEEHLKQVHGDE